MSYNESKQSQFNDAPHVIYLVKHHQHYDGLTSIPALVNCLITVAMAIRRITTRTPPIIIVLDGRASLCAQSHLLVKASG